MTSTPGNSAWPAIPVARWQDTRDSLQLWTQIVGKVRMANTPLINHWWNIPLYVTERGLTTSLIPYHERGFEVTFDLVAHRLDITVTDGNRRDMMLEPRSVADFYAEFMAHLDDLGLSTSIWTMPVEIPDAIPFEVDREHVSYEASRAHDFWLALVQMDRVFTEFRSRFIGKCSPVHLFWGALDLAVTRFSGRRAPLHPGGAPNCGPYVMHEAYSHEVSSAGYWPGGDGEGVFYSYAYPEPPGFRDFLVAPDAAHHDAELDEFVLPYAAVRTAEDPDAVLLQFLQSSYEAAAECASWDRAALERPH